MYVAAWVFLATQILGFALVEDEGRLGAFLRGGAPRIVTPQGPVWTAIRDGEALDARGQEPADPPTS
jgi:hypothetical protein